MMQNLIREARSFLVTEDWVEDALKAGWQDSDTSGYNEHNAKMGRDAFKKAGILIPSGIKNTTTVRFGSAFEVVVGKWRLVFMAGPDRGGTSLTVRFEAGGKAVFDQSLDHILPFLKTVARLVR